MTNREFPGVELDTLDPAQPVAVFLVGGENNLASVALPVFVRAYGADFRQVLFLSVGVMDYAVLDAGADPNLGFKGTEEARRLKEKTRRQLDSYLAVAHEHGLRADVRVSIATDPVEDIVGQTDGLLGLYPKACFFISKMVFRKKRWFHRFLHGGTSDSLRTRLEKKGVPVLMLPLVLSS